MIWAISLAILSILAANLPLLVLAFGYPSSSLDEKRRLAGYSPNQFLFLALFFPVGTALTAWVAYGYLGSDHPGLAVALVLGGLLVGAIVALCDDKYTFRGLYSFCPAKALELVGFHDSLAKVIDSFEDEDRKLVRQAIQGQKVEKFRESTLVLPGGVSLSELQSLRNRLDSACEKEWRDSKLIHPQMRLADALELIAVVATIVVLFLVTAMLVVRESKMEGPDTELLGKIGVCAAAAGSFFPWLGLRQYSLRELKNATGKEVPTISAILLVGFAFIMFSLLVLHSFVGQQWLKQLLSVTSGLLGLITAGATVFAPASARKLFGYEAHWVSLGILALIYLVSAGSWLCILLP